MYLKLSQLWSTNHATIQTLMKSCNLSYPLASPTAPGMFHMCSSATYPPGILTVLLERVVSLLVAVMYSSMADNAASQLVFCRAMSKHHKSVGKYLGQKERQQVVLWESVLLCRAAQATLVVHWWLHQGLSPAKRQGAYCGMGEDASLTLGSHCVGCILRLCCLDAKVLIELRKGFSVLLIVFLLRIQTCAKGAVSGIDLPSQSCCSQSPYPAWPERPVSPCQYSSLSLSSLGPPENRLSSSYSFHLTRTFRYA